MGLDKTVELGHPKTRRVRRRGDEICQVRFVAFLDDHSVFHRSQDRHCDLCYFLAALGVVVLGSANCWDLWSLWISWVLVVTCRFRIWVFELRAVDSGDSGIGGAGGPEESLCIHLSLCVNPPSWVAFCLLSPLRQLMVSAGCRLVANSIESAELSTSLKKPCKMRKEVHANSSALMLYPMDVALISLLFSRTPGRC